MKNKNKIFLIFIIFLLFLITWVGQVRAATYYENSQLVVRGLDKYICQPVVDLVTFTGNSLVTPFKNYYLPEKLVRASLKDFTSIGKILTNPIGKLFASTGNLLAIIPNNLPKLSEVSSKTAIFLGQIMPKFKDWNRIFEVSGQALAIVPNNLPNLHEVSIDLGNLMINSAARVKESVTITLAFLNETFNNLTNNPPKEFYPKTQQLITSAKNNLEGGFNRVVGMPLTSVSNFPNQ